VGSSWGREIKPKITKGGWGFELLGPINSKKKLTEKRTGRERMRRNFLSKSYLIKRRSSGFEGTSSAKSEAFKGHQHSLA